MMEAARSSETLVNFYQTTRRYSPEDSHLHTHREPQILLRLNKVLQLCRSTHYFFDCGLFYDILPYKL
jgi:hypothetical protein